MTTAQETMERPLTQNIRPDGESASLAGYEAAGGYEALRKAVREMAPGEVTNLVKESGLRGRGGGGFPTGMKWSFVAMGENARRPKYVVANADEMEPGTFKDRLLMEGDPHQLIEGVALAAYAIDAEIAYIFLRGEYVKAAHRLEKAIAEASEAGLLGNNILGSGFSLEMHLHTSAGRYMCGQETALLSALEGKRIIPRATPPFATVSGLWGYPSIIQNVETLCNVPHIVRNGVEWFRSISKSEEGGTKIYGVSGKVKRPGSYELPLGTTVGELLEEHAGGMRDGLQFRGALPGGASTDFLTAEHLDVKLDVGSVGEAGSRLGTGTMIVLDDQTCPVGLQLNLQRFYAQESCGWCTPCREGLPWIAYVLEDLENGRGRPDDIKVLDRHVKHLGIGRTFCNLANGAMEPLGSALHYFRDDFVQHVNAGGCPWR